MSIESIKARLEAATEGPWDHRTIFDHGMNSGRPMQDYLDAAFIAKARTDLPAVTRELMEARELLRRWLTGLDNGVVFKLPDDTRAFLGVE